MEKPEKLDLKSMSITDDQKQKLKQLFPEVFTEDKIDWDKLKQTLGEHLDSGDERFGMTWPGKNECFRIIQEPSIGTLKPCPEESVDWDNTENLFIEGDNLEVLKLLQKAYYGKVKMIYIDPPYNTGNEFIYPDKYSESLATYLAYTGQVDSEGRKFSTTSEDDGRRHSKWMNMMYPRLFLARNLLKEDGIIFVSIDDNEVRNLRVLLDDVFGEENFVAQNVWKKSYGGGAKSKQVVILHEYVLMYAKSKESLGILELPPNDDILKYYKFKDKKYKLRGPYRKQPLATNSMDERPNLRYPILWDGNEIRSYAVDCCKQQNGFFK
jgi:adenine-specific DNA-methyltransferase